MQSQKRQNDLFISKANIDILGTSELKWTEKGEFNSDTIISTTVGKNPLEEWSSHHSQQRGPKCSTWMQSQKRQNDLCLFPRQTIQYHGNPSLCPNQ